ncbi:hypothetical protein LOK49_LG03G00496 [Camellia lanceoleosa]|uniref:Uncharacterized protein n=1 Tax=Camellia lanceoleosa TaxID=1840588 RepID=A0ACC0I974_9ERIC|nr:hypothetical protein LOK49_LG03G00496 [Camellia lanceoleosa]
MLSGWCSVQCVYQSWRFIYLLCSVQLGMVLPSVMMLRDFYCQFGVGAKLVCVYSAGLLVCSAGLQFVLLV